MRRLGGFHIGPDLYRHGWSIGLAAFPRDARPGEIRWRFIAEIVLWRGGWFVDVRTWPAWRDVPSVVAEYQRTMRLP